jgi:ATP-dependent Lhr-like helicase
MTSPASGSETSAAFSLLDERIRRWIWEQRWTELREIQERSIPAILQGTEDLILAASTASGKTEAAFLPICSRLVSSPAKSIQALYVGPLKALINDQWDRLDLLCDSLEIPVHRWHGDVGQAAKKKVVAEPSGILLITPESLEAQFVIRGPQLGRIFQHLEFVVIDELHSFMGNERGRQLQSLLHRLELVVRRRIPRIALSATIGEMKLAADFLRPGEGDQVEVIVATSTGQELKLQLKGYRRQAPSVAEDGTRGGDGSDQELAADLFRLLRGTDNLIFANARARVELFADLLRRMSEAAKVPNEFFPHHGSLSKEIREEAEGRLKDRTRPINVVATSTLEMGIDIGSVESIAQVGPPPSVSSLRQRLGRSGRRGKPSVLRILVQEEMVDPKTHPIDSLRADLVESIAMINLLLARWYEPPPSGALHLSTLVQQTLSVIAQHGGATAGQLYRVLAETGPFRKITSKLFGTFLRRMGELDLIRQMHDGTLVLGLTGEKVVNFRDFYAAFQTPEEFRLTCGARTIGTLPISQPVSEGGYLIFAGRRWSVRTLDLERKVIDLEPAAGGRVPLFGGTGMGVHDRVREEMFAVFQSFDVPVFLDEVAKGLLREGRENFQRLRLRETAILARGKETIVFPWVGDRILDTLMLQLQARGLNATKAGIALSILDSDAQEVSGHLRLLAAAGLADPAAVASVAKIKEREKYDHLLGSELLTLEFAARSLDVEGALETAKRIACGATDIQGRATIE